MKFQSLPPSCCCLDLQKSIPRGLRSSPEQCGMGYKQVKRTQFGGLGKVVLNNVGWSMRGCRSPALTPGPCRIVQDTLMLWRGFSRGISSCPSMNLPPFTFLKMNFISSRFRTDKGLLHTADI